MDVDMKLLLKSILKKFFKLYYDNFIFQGHQVQYLRDKENKYETSKLANGITIFTEESSFPFYTDIGNINIRTIKKRIF